MAALCGRARRPGRHQRGDALRRRRPARHLRSRQPDGACAGRLAGVVDGGTLEQQALSALLAREDLAQFLFEHIRVPYHTVVPDETHGEGTNLRFTKNPPAPDELVPKFPSPGELHVVVAGGTAGRFSVAIPGWLGTKNGSRPVTRALENGRENGLT